MPAAPHWPALLWILTALVFAFERSLYHTICWSPFPPSTTGDTPTSIFQRGNWGLSDLPKEMGVFQGTSCPELPQTTGQRYLLPPSPGTHWNPGHETALEPLLLLQAALGPDLPSPQKKFQQPQCLMTLTSALFNVKHTTGVFDFGLGSLYTESFRD